MKQGGGGGGGGDQVARSQRKYRRKCKVNPIRGRPHTIRQLIGQEQNNKIL